MIKITIDLFGRSFEAEVHGLRGQRRYKVFGSITNPEAEELGLSRVTAWRSRRDGHFWLNYHSKEDNSTGRALTLEEAGEVIRCAEIGARLALRTYGVHNLYKEIRPFDMDDLVQEGVERLIRNSGRPEFTEVSWRIGLAKVASLDFIRNVCLRGRSPASPEELPDIVADYDDLEVVEDRSLVAQIRAHVVLNYGFEAWDQIWSWASSTTQQPSTEVAALIRKVIFNA
jgi:NTP pyrophosphatase (non-canonical NTP hydrolase)